MQARVSIFEILQEVASGGVPEKSCSYFPADRLLGI